MTFVVVAVVRALALHVWLLRVFFFVWLTWPISGIFFIWWGHGVARAWGGVVEGRGPHLLRRDADMDLGGPEPWG